MPFTFSHPAIVLPFCKSKWIKFSITALIMGSIVPDMEFLLQLRETHIFGHTWWGILLFDIPVAIVLCFVFHYLVRNLLIVNLPQPLRQRFTLYIQFNWNEYVTQNKIRLFISILAGIFSHLFLDSFTHKYGHIATSSKFFFFKLGFLDYHVPVYMLLQIAFSLIGVLYIAWFIFNMKKANDIVPAENAIRFWMMVFTIAIIIVAFRFLIDRNDNTTPDIVIAITGSFVYALLLNCVFYLLLSKQKKSPAKAEDYINS